jgi:hypothetical protein
MLDQLGYAANHWSELESNDDTASLRKASMIGLPSARKGLTTIRVEIEAQTLKPFKYPSRIVKFYCIAVNITKKQTSDFILEAANHFG